MKPINELRFSISDRIEGAEIGPARVPLALLGQFQAEVADFLKGSSRDVDPRQVFVAIEKGSLTLAASNLSAASSLWRDLNLLEHGDALDEIDPKRATIVEGWQSAARQFPQRDYSIGKSARKSIVRVNAQTNYRKISEDVWVTVEKFFHGKIVDMGGKNKANVHLELENGALLTITSGQDLIAREERNRIYQPALLHIAAEENLRTGALRELKLLSFEQYEPEYDESAFKHMVERGTRAWADVADAAEWVDELRGGKSS